MMQKGQTDIQLAPDHLPTHFVSWKGEEFNNISLHGINEELRKKIADAELEDLDHVKLTVLTKEVVLNIEIEETETRIKIIDEPGDD